MIKPLSPNEILKGKITVFPPEMIKAVNNLLLKNFTGTSCKILSKDIEEEFHRLTNGIYKSENVYKNKWMDFETIFEQAGWIVDYDQPGYCENYEPSFEFTRKRK